ncbi:BZIP domain-containing protein [Balamuthia mandrillaris]
MQQPPQSPQHVDYHTVTRPALDRMGGEELKNLERVLQMNQATVNYNFATTTTPTAQPMDITSLGYNPYLMGQFQQPTPHSPAQFHPPPSSPAQFTTQQMQTPTSPQPTPIHHHHTHRQHTQQTARQPQPSSASHPQYPPIIQFPVVPFWTACPLPFSPLAYPQMIIPPNLAAAVQQQHPIGPQLLRPYQPAAAGAPTQQHPATFHQQPPQQVVNPKLEKYRKKRAKRQWSHPTTSTERPRGGSDPSKLRSNTAPTTTIPQQQELQKKLQDLEEKLSTSEFESQLLREKLVATQKELERIRIQGGTTNKNQTISSDDMFFRQFLLPNTEFDWNDSFGDAIYSPFRSGNNHHSAFKEKIDLSQRKQELKQISSIPYTPEVENANQEWIRALLEKDDSEDDDDLPM